MSLPCSYFRSRGGCRNGATCTWSHDVDRNNDPRRAGAKPSWTSSQAQRPCRFFNLPTGCRKGSSCSFIHSDRQEGNDGKSRASSPRPSVIVATSTSSSDVATNEGRDRSTSFNFRISPTNFAVKSARLLELLAEGAEELRELEILRKKGWESRALDNHFNKQRGKADTQNPAGRVQNSNFFFGAMYRVFKEIDSKLGIVPQYGSIKFLDLGCAPGGFSKYVLMRNQSAEGFGITLPVEEGGHECMLPPNPRYTLEWANLTAYDLRPDSKRTAVLDLPSFPFRTNHFDLVILDGHKLRTHVESDKTRDWDWARLLISQLIIALEAVKHRGNIVMKLSHPEFLNTSVILYLLDQLTQGHVTSFKPTGLHQDRGTFYILAESIQRENNPVYDEYVQKLKQIWWDATYGGEEGKGNPIDSRSLESIVSLDTVCMCFVDRLIDLGRPVWSTQLRGLQKLYHMKTHPAGPSQTHPYSR